jgi:DNA polymerase-3 subunit beta
LFYIFIRNLMKFKASKKELLQALDLASRFVSRNSTLPILENVAIIGNIDTIQLKATDMNKYIHISFPAEIESEWAITVNAKMLLDAVKVSDGEEILLEWKDDGTLLTLISWPDKFEFKWISINEYVAVPEIESAKNVALSSEILSKWIERVESSIPEKSFTTIITWMLLKWKNNTLSFVWTDSFRLAEYKTEVDLTDEFELVIPKSAILEIKKVSDLASTEADTEQANIYYDNKLISFKYKIWNFDIEIKTNLIQWNYPDYEKIILPSYNFKMILDKHNLEKAIKKVSLFSRDISYFVKFIPDENQLIISSGETDLGEWVTKIDAIFEWEAISIWLNWKSILDFLKYVEWEEVIFNIYDDEKPLLIKDQGDEWYRFVIRPLKE